MSKIGNITERFTDTRLNARSLALSVLLGSHPPELPASAFVSLATLFDIAAGTMRTAISRMLAAGELEAVDGRYRLSGPLLARQAAQDAGRRAPDGRWDGDWHTLVVADAQRDVTARRHFRVAMANDRFGELRPDIWMRPSNLAAPPPRPDRIVTTGPITGLGAERLVARLWDLERIGSEATALIADLRRLHAELDWSDPASIPPVFVTSAAVVRFLRAEPLLPTELTPTVWPVDALRLQYDLTEVGFQHLLQGFLRTG